MGRSSIINHFGEWDIDERINDDGWYAGHPMESDEAAVQRAKNVKKWIEEELVPSSKAASKPTRVALVIHADFKMLLLDEFSQSGCSSFGEYRSVRRYGHEPWNTSVTEVLHRDGDWLLEDYNRVAHLPKDEWSS